jgi:hypothetical protein
MMDHRGSGVRARKARASLCVCICLENEQGEGAFFWRSKTVYQRTALGLVERA